MIKELDKFAICFNENDKNYIDELVYVLNNKVLEIMDFFRINAFDEKIVIKIYDDRDKYKNNLINAWRKNGINRDFQDNFIANTEDGCINMLSFDLVRGIKDFEDYSIDEFCYNVRHEFVHICQQIVGSVNDGWFWEVLATNLGNPECQREVKINCSLDDVKYRFDEIDGYGVVYTIGKYLFSNYSKDFILELVLDNDKLLDFENKLFDEVICSQKDNHFHK